MNELSDVNIEFAHVEFDEHGFDERIVAVSARIAKELLTKYEGQGLRCSTCILLDDKNMGRIPNKLLQRFLDFVGRHIDRVDYICYEGQLPRYLEGIFDNIRDNKRAYVEGRIYSYYHNHGKIACSHDIAIWHYIRLGLINDVDASTLFPVSALRGSERPPAPFVARKVVSILDSMHRPFEEKAVSDILRYSKQSGITNKIKRIFF